MSLVADFIMLYDLAVGVAGYSYLMWGSMKVVGLQMWTYYSQTENVRYLSVSAITDKQIHRYISSRMSPTRS